MLLLPQIPRFIAHEIATRLSGLSISEARQARAIDHPLKFFSPTGGAHANPQTLDSLRDEIERVAKESGYPGQRNVGKFDYAVTELLHRILRITRNEASRPGVWQFLGCVLMPDIVIWRQRRADGGPVNLDNFLDSSNNLFRRLWWRAAIFDDRTRAATPYWLLEDMLEDAIQTFYERRGLSGTPGMGLAFGRVYHATSRLLPAGFNMEPVERVAQKWLVRTAESIALDCLDDTAKIRLVADAFAKGIPSPLTTQASGTLITENAIALARGTTVAIAPPLAPPAVRVEPPKPKQVATLFGEQHKRAFAADRGAFSTVTVREADASEVNLTGPEAKIAEEFFGRDRIHLGPVKANPIAALQRFREHPTGQLIYLNLVYPKSDRSEMRLYLSQQKGFKPSAGWIWFLYQRKRELYLGAMSPEDWELFLVGKKGV